ncbi:hypothetical protein T4D_11030 [Trichinella pseudospiralis]|uniref:PiggyBac transposable element-derived protein domain-containing protein n=1 Tax=Trichinella pseudospiralis TaxID=6337 RepID=A0A0V1F7V8_TRIPS|nr:hypothetical protein T4D_11030 [Trichinella pseudospiralis]
MKHIRPHHLRDPVTWKKNHQMAADTAKDNGETVCLQCYKNDPRTNTKTLDVTYLRVYIGTLILGGVYSLSLKKFYQVSRMMQFNNHSSRAHVTQKTSWQIYLKRIILLKTLQLMIDCILSKVDVSSDSRCQKETGKPVVQSQAMHGICKFKLASRQVELTRRTKACE